LSRVKWQEAARTASELRRRQPFHLWIAGPVEVSVDGDVFRQCVHELTVARPAVLPLLGSGAGQPARTLRAVVDTGCTSTAIRADLAAELGLPPVGIIDVNTSSSGGESIPCQTVMADLRLADATGSEILVRHALIVMDMSDELLLGMDLLGGGVLTIDLVDGVWDWKRYVPAGEPEALPAR
jgi:hypothetical protein